MARGRGRPPKSSIPSRSLSSTDHHDAALVCNSDLSSKTRTSPNHHASVNDLIVDAFNSSNSKVQSNPTILDSSIRVQPNSAISNNSAIIYENDSLIVSDTLVAATIVSVLFSAVPQVTETPLGPGVTPETGVFPDSGVYQNGKLGEMGGKKWLEVVKPKKPMGMSLFLHQECQKTGDIDIVLEDIQDELKLWQSTLMGHVIGIKPSFKQLTNFVDKHWGGFAKPIVQYFKKGWFSFRFSSETEMNNVLKVGPWKVNSCSLILKQWTPSFSTIMEKVSTIPIWVLFPDLDPYLWSSIVLSKMASRIGRLMFADVPTTCKGKLSFARVMVEADISSSLSETISCKRNQPKAKEVLPKVVVTKKVFKPITVPNPFLLGDNSATEGVQDTSKAVPKVSSKLSVAVRHSECSKKDKMEASQIALKRDLLSDSGIQPQIALENSFGPLTEENEGQVQLHLNTNGESGLNLLLLGGTSTTNGETSPSLNRQYVQQEADFAVLNPGIVSTPQVVVMHSGCNREHGMDETQITLKIVSPSALEHTTLGDTLPPDREMMLKRGFFLWDALYAISKTVDSWSILGDFNVVRNSTERIGNNPPSLEDMLAFNACLLNCGVDDLSGTGCEFTWTNKQEVEDRMWSKLNRALVNHAWLWNVKQQLKLMHKNNYSGIARRVKEAKGQLYHCQEALQHDALSPTLLQQEKDLLMAYIKLKNAEKISLQQKVKILHISQNDSSTKYFYSRIQERKSQQIVGQIRDRHGQGLDNVASAFIDYYENLLGSATDIVPLDVQFIQSGACLQDGDLEALIKPIENSEIKQALFEIGSDKSPGPDGFSSAFFKASWSQVGDDFCKSVQAFFKSGKMGKQANATLITLIPKKKKHSENIMLSQSLVKGYDRKYLTPRYLGLTLNTARNTTDMYGLLISKLQTKVQYWANKFLSYAGKA
ncbi:uncharacterized protein LOC141632103 [Silene latifolia]|uniref:uncharacterized protein LOC141632103 n=1 Tax=Silene latifolia TaxID=37657 RepID=UPI003D76A8C9